MINWTALGTGLSIIAALATFHKTLFMQAMNFKHFDVESKEVKVEHRSFINTMLIVIQKTGIVRIDSHVFQLFARYLTAQFNEANVNFADTRSDPKVEIAKFCAKHGIDADVNAVEWEWSKRPRDYANINEFFMRRYKKFAVSSASDLVSPATSVVQRFESLEKMDCLVKGARYTLESCGVPSPEVYADTECYYFYLSPADYHCFHSPLEGTIERIVDITGLGHCSGSVKPDLLDSKPSILLHNRRFVVVLRRGSLRVALVIIGGFLVDSVRMSRELKEGRAVEKGQFLGSFALGGSAILMLTNINLSMVHSLNDAVRNTDLPVKVTAGREFANVAKESS